MIRSPYHPDWWTAVDEVEHEQASANQYGVASARLRGAELEDRQFASDPVPFRLTFLRLLSHDLQGIQQWLDDNPTRHLRDVAARLERVFASIDHHASALTREMRHD